MVLLDCTIYGSIESAVQTQLESRDWVYLVAHSMNFGTMVTRLMLTVVLLCQLPGPLTLGGALEKENGGGGDPVRIEEVARGLDAPAFIQGEAGAELENKEQRKVENVQEEVAGEKEAVVEEDVAHDKIEVCVYAVCNILPSKVGASCYQVGDAVLCKLVAYM